MASIAAFVIDELEAIKLQSERIVGDLFEEGVVEHGPAVPSIPMAAPDTGKLYVLSLAIFCTETFQFLCFQIFFPRGAPHHCRWGYDTSKGRLIFFWPQ